MKKKSRFLTGLLSAVMALSLCAMPAAADDVNPKATTANPVWTQDTGSITIHKYEWNGTKNGAPATGEENDTQLPVGDDGKKPTPLAGATFEIYKVHDENWLKSYYSYSSSETFDFKKWNVYAEKSGNAYKVKSDANLKKEKDATTDATGKAEFKDLPLGLYLVIESKAPDSVTTACEPFFVSVPMTKVKDSQTNPLSDWLYNVHVYPKNKTSYGDATLQKIGKQSGNDTENITMEGYKFKLYKKQETGAWMQITKLPKNGVDNTGDAIGENGVLTTNANGQISVSGLSNGVYAFVETGVNAADGYILDSGIAYVFKIDNAKMVKAADTDVAADIFPEGTTSFDFTSFDESGTSQVKVVNYKPDFKKEVTKRGKTTTSADNDADYAIGDEVPYTLTINVPENIAKLNTFKVTDTMDKTQLLCNEKSIVVKAEDTQLSEDNAYTLTMAAADSSNSGFTIDFKANAKTAINSYAGKTITITYTATLQHDASVDVAGNVNKADLRYSKKTNIAEGETDEPYDIHDEAVVYTFKTGILKKGDDGKKLQGVEFTLYKKFEDTKDTGYIENEETVGAIFAGNKKPFLSDDETKKLGLDSTAKWFEVTNLITKENGIDIANGLPNGTYKLVETKTNEGYNLLSGPVDANLTIDYKTTWNSTTSFDNNGQIIKHGEAKTTTFNDGKYEYKEITIINRKGFNLPVTGGFGTLLFSAIGALLVVGGVGVLMSTKKKKKGNA